MKDYFSYAKYKNIIDTNYHWTNDSLSLEIYVGRIEKFINIFISSYL